MLTSTDQIPAMNVLNVHGFRGAAENCAYSALKSNGCNVISPAIDYDAESPDKVLEKLRDIADKQHIDFVVGTSLGGFFAAVFAAERNLPLILVNPCLLPFLHLPRLDYKGDIRPFIPLFANLTKIDINKVSCIVGAKDEVIDSHDFTKNMFNNERFRIVPEGMHAGATLPLPDYFREILPFYSQLSK